MCEEEEEEEEDDTCVRMCVQYFFSLSFVFLNIQHTTHKSFIIHTTAEFLCHGAINVALE